MFMNSKVQVENVIFWATCMLLQLLRNFNLCGLVARLYMQFSYFSIYVLASCQNQADFGQQHIKYWIIEAK